LHCIQPLDYSSTTLAQIILEPDYYELHAGLSNFLKRIM